MRPRSVEIIYFDKERFGEFLRTLDSDSRFATELAMSQVLPKARQIESSKWIKSLGASLMQFRIGPTTASVLSRNLMPPGRIVARQPMLIRVFFVYEADHKIVVLRAYDKTKNRARLSQQREIAQARRNLKKWSDSNVEN